ncbi:hypothetical protein BGX24_004278 [Mortierella sp. AD032]|nr:hypothetical protein BGX24_004278 [Mortierella sp. AD032]
MLSSHQGKSVPSPSPSTVSIDNSRPYFNIANHNRRTSTNDSFGSTALKDEPIEPSESMDIHQLMLQKTNMKKNSASPRKQFANSGNRTTTQQTDNSFVGLENVTSSSKRLHRADLSIATDLLHHQQQHGSSPIVHPGSMQQQQHPHSARPAISDNEFLWSTPPANCKMPNPNLSRRASLAAVVMSPEFRAGPVKSAANHGIFSSNDFVTGESIKESDTPKQKVVQKRLNNLSGPSRRHSVPNLSQTAARQVNSNNNNNNGNNINIGKSGPLQRMAIGMFGMSGTAIDGSYLPTPTESVFHGSISGELSHLPDFSTSNNQGITQHHLPPTPVDAYFSSGVHPFDILSGGTGITDGWTNNSTTGMPPVPPPMSTATKSATIQYLQQLQQSIILPDSQCFPTLAPQPGQQPQSTQQKPSQTLSQSRRGSKAKAKRRVGNLPAPAPPMLQSYIPTDMNWSLPPSDQQLLINEVHQQPQYNNSNVSLRSSMNQSSTATTAATPTHPSSQTSSTTPRTFYHGPAPCGNSEPLYEYLASPTIVPGLEIIGHDFYGNYVQILPICPDTTCSMNQDPVYLNLLQAIYAHTIPFLDLAPGSEEESQLLNNGTPSAITTQSIQPPFKNLLPLNGPAGQSSGAYSAQLSSSSGSHAALSQHSTLTYSVSSPSFQQLTNNGSNSAASSNKLHRRASMASISSINGNTATNSRRSSIASNPSLSNPARKKKNAPRTHPYKSTSSFKEDNPMVTEAILTQVGGLGGIGNSATVAEKMVHMDEAEYAAHYSKHQQVMNKSVSTTALCLAQTLVNSMSGCSLGPLNPSSLMSSSVTAPSITNAMTSSSIGNGSVANPTSSSLETIAAADFIRALSECSGSINDLGLQGEGVSPAVADISLSEHDLLSLESLMMMDSNVAAAVQAAAATAWPNWFDLSQLEKDMCEAGLGHQASAFSSASCSMANLPLSTSSTLTSFANNHHGHGITGKDAATTNLLLSSSTNLEMMDDLFEDNNTQQSQSADGSKGLTLGDQDIEMTMAMSPSAKVSHVNSTSQVLVFDQLTASPLQQGSGRGNRPSGESTSSLSSRASTDATAISNNNGTNSDDGYDSNIKTPISNDLTLPYTSSLLTVLPFSAHHSHPIFPTRGNRRSGWYRSKSVASQGLSQITGVDYTTTCWYDVERLQNVVRDSISFQESSGLKSLEDLTEPNPSSTTTSNN